jgi:hypothetical protein
MARLGGKSKLGQWRARPDRWSASGLSGQRDNIPGENISPHPGEWKQLADTSAQTVRVASQPMISLVRWFRTSCDFVLSSLPKIQM